MRKHFVASLLVSAAVIGLPAVTEAAPKTGCPAEASGWQELTVAKTANAVYAGLLDNPFANAGELAKVLTGYDRNGDGRLCLLTRWGDHLNPNSNWYRIGMAELGVPASLFLVVDNNANARK